MTLIEQVALEAGVTPVFASIVLHHRATDLLDPINVARVEDIAARVGLGFEAVPVQKRSVLFVVPETYARNQDSPYFMNLILGAIQSAFDHGRTLAMRNIMSVEDCNELAEDPSYEGVVWMTTCDYLSAARIFARHGIPLSVVHGDPDEAPPNVSCYGCDNAQGIDLAVDHLVQLGHRKIAYYAWPNFVSRESAIREKAVAESLERRGLTAYPTVTHVFDSIEPMWMPHIRNGLTAVISSSDGLALRGIQMANREKLWLPDQLSIVGFDSTSFCDSTLPRITSVSQPIAKMAYEAVASVIDQVSDFANGNPPHRLYKCGFDIRESTSPPIGF